MPKKLIKKYQFGSSIDQDWTSTSFGDVSQYNNWLNKKTNMDIGQPKGLSSLPGLKPLMQPLDKYNSVTNTIDPSASTIGAGVSQPVTNKEGNVTQSNGTTDFLKGMGKNFGLVQGAGNIIGGLGGYQQKAGDQLVDTIASTASQFGPVGAGIGAGLEVVKTLGQLTSKNYKGFDQTVSSSSYGNTTSVADNQSWLMFGDSSSHKNQVNAAKTDYASKQINVDAQRKKSNAALNYGNQMNVKNQYSLAGGYNPDSLLAKNGAKLKTIKNKVHNELTKSYQKKIVAEEKVSPVISQKPVTIKQGFSILKNESKKLEDGGTIPNLIPSGALHARLNHYEGELGDAVTSKGIPVVTMDEGGELLQHAEIERNELIFNKDVTSKLEEMHKKLKDGDESVLIEAGKLLVHEILENTTDNTGLLNEINV